ncbi:hypothetical protein B9479_002022 [Cryptococcus floricola]|uniref:DH domain-containing protein n=1 Tax=Cryptococcus floricola TaxID=2591691 RepID=A0A5D3B3V0_9TREE|nr:hypothetical protein B9479_002022 [Cryptococcus floricola]
MSSPAHSPPSAIPRAVSVSDTVRRFEARSGSSIPTRIVSSPASTSAALPARTLPHSPRKNPLRNSPSSNRGSPSYRPPSEAAQPVASTSTATSPPKPRELGLGSPRDERRASETAGIRQRGQGIPAASRLPHSVSLPRDANLIQPESDDFSPRSETSSQSGFGYSPSRTRLRPSISISGVTPERRMPPLRRRAEKSEGMIRTGSADRILRVKSPPSSTSRQSSFTQAPSSAASTQYFTPSPTTNPLTSPMSGSYDEGERTDSIVDGYFSLGDARNTVYLDSPAVSRPPSATDPYQKREDVEPAVDSDGVPALGNVVLPSDLSRQLSSRPVLHSRSSSASSLSVNGTSGHAGLRRGSSGIASPSLSRSGSHSRSNSPLSHNILTTVIQEPSPRKSPRKSPQLRINPPALPSSANLFNAISSLPTPPVPTKSPLRNFSGRSSVVSSSSRRSGGEGEERSEASTPHKTPQEDGNHAQERVKKVGSMESVMAVAGTPLSAATRMGRMADVTTVESPVKSPLTYSSPPAMAESDRSSSLAEVESPVGYESAAPPRSSQDDQRGSSQSQNEIRFTMLTAPSIYSQSSASGSNYDSGPGSAKSWGTEGTTTPRSAESRFFTASTSSNPQPSPSGKLGTERPNGHEIQKRRPLSGVMDHIHVGGWGKKKEEKEKGKESEKQRRFSNGSEKGHRRSSSLPRPSFSMSSDNDSPYANRPSFETRPSFESRPSFETRPSFEKKASFGTPNNSSRHLPPTTSTPLASIPQERSPAKSPSLPILRDPSFPTIATPTGAATGMGKKRAETSKEPLSSLLSGTQSAKSKRSHVLKEIAESERAYAKDLALVRDAFMMPLNLQIGGARPDSMVSFSSSTSSGGSLTPGTPSTTARPGHSKRSSIYTYQTAETSRSSTTSAGGPPSATSIPKSPSEGFNMGYFSNNAKSRESLVSSNTPNQAIRTSGIMAPPVGKPLSPADIKAVFLNLDHLAAVADELATSFEEALGREEEGAGKREGEKGDDRLGQVFVAMVPKLRPLYNYYCSRQPSASRHLQTLLSSPLYALHLKAQWAVISPHTHAWNLDSMLIKPVQRLTKYPLLFEDLGKVTTPVHGDYFGIREAGIESRKLAVEVDEGRRRKEVVEMALSNGSVVKKPVGTDKKEAKPQGSKLLGLKRFKKSSVTASASSTTLASASTGPTAPSLLSDSSLHTLKAHQARLQIFNTSLKTLGQDILLWTASAKEVLRAEDAVLRAWDHVGRLEEGDRADHRVLEMRNVVDGLVDGAWSELSVEIKTQILPILSTLLKSMTNPSKVLTKRSSLHADYTKYHSHSSAPLTKKLVALEPNVVKNAQEFVALHEQLLEELPAFLEGCMRILDIAVVGFANAQARYFSNIRVRVREFCLVWVKSPIGVGIYEGADGIRSSDEQMTGDELEKAWYECWKGCAAALDKFQCTQSSYKPPNLDVRMGLNRPRSRTTSLTNSTDLPSPTLRHSASTNNALSSPTSSFFGSARGDRLSGAASSSGSAGASFIVTSPGGKEDKRESGGSRFNLLRRSNSKSAVPQLTTPSKPTHTRQGSGLRPSSATSESSRRSWGLPQIPNTTSEGFKGLGLSPTSSLTVSPRQSPRPPQFAGAAEPPSPSLTNGSLVSPNPSFGFGSSGRTPEFGKTPEMGTPRSGISGYFTSRTPDLNMLSGDRHPYSRGGATASEASLGSLTGLGIGDVPMPMRSPGRRGSGHPFASPTLPPGAAEPGDVSDGWREEPMLYQCACVADFDPMELGNRRYRGLKFLRMLPGDLIDILHEVGRIEDLPLFPYPGVGVENDGVLVGKGEDGEIGLVICSFLEPLRD